MHVGVLALVQVQPEPVGVCAVAGSVTVRAVPVDVAAAETSSELAPQVESLTPTTVLPDYPTLPNNRA